MQGCSRLQTLAADRVRHAPLEARVPKAGDKRASRELSGKFAAVDQVTDRRIVARYDNLYNPPARVGVCEDELERALFPTYLGRFGRGQTERGGGWKGKSRQLELINFASRYAELVHYTRTLIYPNKLITLSYTLLLIALSHYRRLTRMQNIISEKVRQSRASRSYCEYKTFN